MKNFQRILALSLSLLAAGCGGGGGGDPVQPSGTVVLVYMIGSTLESGIEAYGSANLAEMMAAGALTDTTVVVQTGGANKTGTPPTDPRSMQPANIDWTHLQRYVVHPSSLEQVVDLGAESRTDPSLNMASTFAFMDFMDWAVENYPASRYVLVLWDHGGGINIGIGADENTLWRLPVADIGMVLQATASRRGAPVELVGFDACLMATAETAVALRWSSRYMVASEDLEPGSGWDYRALLRYVDANPSASGAGIGAEIVRTFVEKQKAEGEEDVTLSVVDVDAAVSVAVALDDLAGLLKPYAQTVPGWRAIARGRSQTIDWATPPFKREGLDLADLKGFATHAVDQILANLGPDPTLAEKRDDLVDAITAAVTTNAALGANARATGLSVYFPSVLAGLPAKGYDAHTTMGGWPFFASRYTSGAFGMVQAYFDFYLANQGSLRAFVSMTHDPEAPLSALVENDFDLVMAGHQAPACEVIRVSGVVEVPCVDSVRFPDEVTRLLGAAVWRVDTAVDATWPTLVDGAGTAYPVALLPDTYGGKLIGSVNEYLVPVHLRVVEEKKTSHLPGALVVREIVPAAGVATTYEITGFQPDDEAPGRVLPVVDGQVYTVRVYATVRDEPAWQQTGRALTVSNGTLTLDFRPVEAGQFAYFVTDLAGELRQSELVPYPPVP